MFRRWTRAVPRHLPWPSLALLGAILAVALLLRASLIALNRFHYDEALYSYWGLLIASGRDPWLRAVSLDKPPLFFYVLALFFRLFGPGEVIARLPNLMASVASIALLYRLALDLYDRRVARLAALFLALSPFDIQYAPTAFTDPLMVCLALAACLLALRKQLAWAGVALGLAVMTKPTAAFFLPLLLYLAATRSAGPARRPARGWAWAGLGAGAGAAVGGGFLWDSLARPLETGFWRTGVSHLGGLTLMAWPTIPGRLQAWAGMMRYITGSWPLNLTLIAGVPALLACGLWRRDERPGWQHDWALAAFALAFVAGHTLLSFNLWDRYLLGLAPVAALILARAVLLPYDLLACRQGVRWRVAYGCTLAVLLTAALAFPVRKALRYGFPVGGDHGAFQGIDDVGRYLKAAPAGSIVFQRFLDWHLSYYAFGAPVQLQYYSSPDFVLDMASHTGSHAKFAVFADWAPPGELGSTLRAHGWQLVEVHRSYRANGSTSFTVYRLEPVTAGYRPAPGG